MVEIQALQNKQKTEIEELFKRLGKTPPSVVVPPTIAMAGGRRRPTKSKGNKLSRNGASQASSVQQGMKLMRLLLTVIFGHNRCEQFFKSYCCFVFLFREQTSRTKFSQPVSHWEENFSNYSKLKCSRYNFDHCSQTA